MNEKRLNFDEKRGLKIGSVYLYDDGDNNWYPCKRYTFILTADIEDGYSIRFHGDGLRSNEKPQWEDGWVSFTGNWANLAKRIA